MKWFGFNACVVPGKVCSALSGVGVGAEAQVTSSIYLKLCVLF